jgi:anti-sigma factor ChrR (cupin superfamily)
MRDITFTSATREAPSGSRYVDVAAIPWSEPFPGIRMKVLYKDNDAKEATILFQTAPGTVIPEHVHGGVEWAFVLEGTMEDAEGIVAAGNFVIPAHREPTLSSHSERREVYRLISWVRAFSRDRKTVPRV